MLRKSTLPKRMAESIDDPLKEEELRRFGSTVQVYFSSDRCKLDISGSIPSPPHLYESAGLISNEFTLHVNDKNLSV
jgi:hypothetical protein